MALSRGLPRLGRRPFLRATSGALLGLLSPDRSRASELSRPVLVCLNLVGGLDGLSVLVPHGEDAYYRARPQIAVPRPGRPGGALPLTDGFGLHPRLEPLYSMFLEGTLAIVPAAGGAHFGRSHFTARAAMHSAAPAGSRALGDGWANRYGALRAAEGAPTLLYSTTPELAQALSGPASVNFTADRRHLPDGAEGESYLAALRRLYRGAADPFARSAERALAQAAQVRDKTRAVRLRGDYGKSGQGLREAARLVLADVGAEIVWVEVDGFDTHKSQGAAEGQLAGKLAQLARSISAFRSDLGAAFRKVTLVTLTEFGRTLRENGAGGTDHGSASCMLVLGGRVQGGRLAGAWPGLSPSDLHGGRELAVTTDYRAVLADLLASHLGLDEAGLDHVLPGFDRDARAPLGLCAAATDAAR